MTDITSNSIHIIVGYSGKLDDKAVNIYDHYSHGQKYAFHIWWAGHLHIRQALLEIADSYGVKYNADTKSFGKNVICFDDRNFYDFLILALQNCVPIVQKYEPPEHA